jgi:hypothetical protein
VFAAMKKSKFLSFIYETKTKKWKQKTVEKAQKKSTQNASLI